MSLSGLIEQNYIVKAAALQALLDLHGAEWRNSPTQELRLAVEGKVLAKLDTLLAQDIDLQEVTVFDHPEKEDFDAAYDLYRAYLAVNNGMLAAANQQFLTRTNNHKLVLNELMGQVKRIKQKHATLNLWQGDAVRYFLAEKFLNLDKLDYKFTSVDPAEIHTTQGILTLPIQSRERVTLQGIRLGADSNGQAGSSDVTVDSSTQDINTLLDSGEKYFEYERLDQGPCKCVLVLELTKPQLMNSITIKPVNVGYPLSVQVKNIQFTLTNKESISVHDLIPNSPSDAFSISAATEEEWELSFLPVEATSVAITLVQTQPYQLDVATSDGQTAIRNRYAIALRNITLNRDQYKEQGGVNSLSTKVRNNLYACEPVVRANPSTNELYDLTLEVSFDDGVTWKTAQQNDDASILLVEDNRGSFIWRLALQRNAQAFSSFTSFVESTIPGKIKTILKPVSRFNSPVNLALGSKPKDGNVFVIQPKIARRGQKDKALRLGSTSSGPNQMKVPFNVLKHGLKPEQVHVYVGGSEYARKLPGEVVGALEWSFADSHDEITLSSDLPAGTSIDIGLDEELMLLQENSDGYHHKMKLNFDPDKPNIEIVKVSAEPSRGSVVLPRDNKIVYLGSKNLLSGTLVINSSAGNSYTEQDTRDLVYDAEDFDYYVDYPNGVLYLASYAGDDTVRCSFDYQAEIKLASDAFDIVYAENRPWGVKINKDRVEATSVSEVLNDALLPIIDISTGVYGPRETIIDTASTTRRQLSHTYIIAGTFTAPEDLFSNELFPEEVDYIDGVGEFLGLTQVTSEKTNRTNADSTGVISFALSARSLWYRDLDVSFSDTSVFQNAVASANAVTTGGNGDYYIDDEGTLYIQVGSGGTLPGGINMSYYFKSDTFDPGNKFSVDYENGVLYAHEPLNPLATIAYKVARYKVSYDVAAEMADAEYNSLTNSVSIRTENMNTINNLVKVVWTEAEQELVNQQLEQYFSPLIDLVGFRFS